MLEWLNDTADSMVRVVLPMLVIAACSMFIIAGVIGVAWVISSFFKWLRK